MTAKKPIALDDETKQRSIASIKRYFKEELELDIGDLKAALILDYFVTEHGPAIYNSAIADARAFFDERSADLLGDAGLRRMQRRRGIGDVEAAPRHLAYIAQLLKIHGLSLYQLIMNIAYLSIFQK